MFTWHSNTSKRSEVMFVHATVTTTTAAGMLLCGCTDALHLGHIWLHIIHHMQGSPDVLITT
jgi:hypothetical protein